MAIWQSRSLHLLDPEALELVPRVPSLPSSLISPPVNLQHLSNDQVSPGTDGTRNTPCIMIDQHELIPHVGGSICYI